MSSNKASIFEVKITQKGGAFVPFNTAKHAFERNYVELVLREANGNVSQAAQLAQKERKDFYDLMRRCKVDPKRFRS